MKAKSQTESTKKIEEAIEKVEEATVDNVRLNELKQKTSELKYPTKPSVVDIEIVSFEEESKNKTVGHRQHIESASDNVSQKFYTNNKYADVKPRIITRLNTIQSARNDDSVSNANKFNTSQTDILNDSYSLR
jgi:hypothetical protein